MAKKSKSKKAAKGKPVKNKTVAKKATSKKKLSPGAKTKNVVQSKIAQAADIAMGANAYGVSVGDVVGLVKGKKGSKAAGGKKRRRGVVPKVVKKWASRYARKRKQTEKVVRNVFGSDGSKLLGPRRKRSYGGSPGFITQAEVREAMRR